MNQKLYSRLKGKRITVAVTGGIAAYKSCELVRLLVKSGAEVRVCMTQAALNFVGPLTFSALSGHPVETDQFNGSMQHLALTRNCDLLIVAPATANILAKAANGIADDLVSSVILAADCPVAVCPAMNSNMWAKPSTQRNIARLKADGFEVLGPACGELACGVTGAGRMIEPCEIAAHAARILSPRLLLNRKVVVTAGPTYEALDPVRGITNLSSGKQGYAIAQAAFEAGADVVLISGPTALEPPVGVRFTAVRSACEMAQAVQKAVADAQIFISVAAVADWRAEIPAEEKIKKTDSAPQLRLVENPDILAAAAKNHPDLYCVGFAAETENVLTYARSKLERKKARLIVANNARSAIGSDMNDAWLVTQQGETATGAMNKQALAERIVEHIAADLNQEAPPYGLQTQ